MGAEDVASRIENPTVNPLIIHVTRLKLFRFEPQPPLFEVHHMVLEYSNADSAAEGQKPVIIASSTTVHEDLMEAQSQFALVHDNPPAVQ